MVGWGGLPVFRSLGWLRLVGLLRSRPSAWAGRRVRQIPPASPLRVAAGLAPLRFARVCRQWGEAKARGRAAFSNMSDSPRSCGLSNTSEVGRARAERPQRPHRRSGRGNPERYNSAVAPRASDCPRHGWCCRPGSFDCRRRRAASRHPMPRVGRGSGGSHRVPRLDPALVGARCVVRAGGGSTRLVEH